MSEQNQIIPNLELKSDIAIQGATLKDTVTELKDPVTELKDTVKVLRTQMDTIKVLRTQMDKMIQDKLSGKIRIALQDFNRHFYLENEPMFNNANIQLRYNRNEVSHHIVEDKGEDDIIHGRMFVLNQQIDLLGHHTTIKYKNIDNKIGPGLIDIFVKFFDKKLQTLNTSTFDDDDLQFYKSFFD
jgi:hypothetical protein